MIVVVLLLVLANLALLVPATIFAVEVLASLLPQRSAPQQSGDRPAVAVIVPAHQEEDGIGDTVTALRSQLRRDDRLLVVADNCTDRTAMLAREAGAEVVERVDPARRGKGFALDFGVRYLAEKPPTVVILVDADCRLAPGAINHLAADASASGRPAQGLYLLSAPPDSGIGLQVAELAFLVKNQVRPAGLHRLGLPCHLTGSGMAFPWPVLRDANLAHGSLVEDMKLGLDLALVGTPAIYCPQARISSFFPYSASGAASQRSRWEEGHLGMTAMAFRQLPRAVAARSIGALALTLDTIVPPLTLLIMLVGTSFVVTAGLTLALGLSGAALWLSGINCLLLGLAAFLAWHAHGRQILPARAMLGVVPFALSKFKLYRALAGGKRSGDWIRTDRKGPDAS